MPSRKTSVVSRPPSVRKNESAVSWGRVGADMAPSFAGRTSLDGAVPGAVAQPRSRPAGSGGRQRFEPDGGAVDADHLALEGEQLEVGERLERREHSVERTEVVTVAFA